MASADAGSLVLDEGVVLGYALVSRIADTTGIRVLGIKGVTLSALGLRPTRTVLDVDVLVEPARVGALLAALGAHGWQTTVVDTGAHVLDVHSVQVGHPLWPCDIDVHRYFPGFLASPEVVFDELWSRRITVTIGGAPITTPDRVGSAAIAALHLLRGGQRRQAEFLVQAGLIREELSPAEVAELFQLAHVTGAMTTLEPLWSRLDAAGVDDVSLGSSEDAGTLLAQWHLAQNAKQVRSLAWVRAFMVSPAREWPGLLWRSLWLTDAELRRRYPWAKPGLRGWIRMVVHRWWAGLRGFPTAVLMLRDHRHRRGSEAMTERARDGN